VRRPGSTPCIGEKTLRRTSQSPSSPSCRGARSTVPMRFERASLHPVPLEEPSPRTTHLVASLSDCGNSRATITVMMVATMTNSAKRPSLRRLVCRYLWTWVLPPSKPAEATRDAQRPTMRNGANQLHQTPTGSASGPATGLSDDPVLLSDVARLVQNPTCISHNVRNRGSLRG